VNLDPYHSQAGMVELPLEQLGLPADRSFEMEDMLTGKRYTWHERRSYVELSPQGIPAHVFRVRK
jgi:starch synthase (maltosyl-transferring)